MTMLDNRRVLVTGAAVRVGRRIALTLAHEGADVAIHYGSSAEAAQDLATELRAAGSRVALIQGDLREPNMAARVVDEASEALGGLDALINNASVFRRTPLDTLSDDDWALHIDVNLTAPFRTSMAAVPHFERAGGGKIVNLVDLSAFRPWPSYIPHSVSKAGLMALTRGLARALAPRGIQVNAVAPGAVLWPDDMDDAARAAEERRIPGGRAGSAEDVAHAVCYLLTASHFVTGDCLRVDGGRSLV